MKIKTMLLSFVRYNISICISDLLQFLLIEAIYQATKIFFKLMFSFFDIKHAIF